MKKRAILFLIAVFLLGGAFFAGSLSSKPATQNIESQKDYPLLAKRLFIENPNDIRINFSPLRKDLRQYFSDNKLEGSIYFEYLPTGSSIRVNSNDEFRAASLIKLPVAMELFKAVEQGKVSLDEKVALKQEWLNDGYGTLYEKGVGYELTYRDAVKILLTESDNTALRMIIEATDGLAIEDRALGALDVEFSQDGGTDGINIGTRSYSSFLKCLYFACYNNKNDSQQILDYLTMSTFDNRLVAGITDKNTKVAHKIGVFNTQVQSDCGIVYLESKNYVICIMLRGNDNETTNGHFAKLSELTNQFVKNN